MNIRTIGELRVLPVGTLEALFGAPGRLLFERCRGRDTAPVVAHEVPLSISRETSFHQDTADRREVEGMLEYLVGRACRRPASSTSSSSHRGRAASLRRRRGAPRSALAAPSSADPLVLDLAPSSSYAVHAARRFTVGVTLSSFVAGAAEQVERSTRSAPAPPRAVARARRRVTPTATAHQSRAGRFTRGALRKIAMDSCCAPSHPVGVPESRRQGWEEPRARCICSIFT
jgi:DNA polymerase-4